MCSITWARSLTSITPPQSWHRMKCSASLAGFGLTTSPLISPRLSGRRRLSMADLLHDEPARGHVPLGRGSSDRCIHVRTAYDSADAIAIKDDQRSQPSRADETGDLRREMADLH